MSLQTGSTSQTIKKIRTDLRLTVNVHILLTEGPGKRMTIKKYYNNRGKNNTYPWSEDWSKEGVQIIGQVHGFD